ncbi:MAG: glycine cleavage system H-protein subunit [Bogoriella megaspora]|nr:MAG: glycine cleavage system H-protein subunit [Bogoriella megaspora]
MASSRAVARAVSYLGSSSRYATRPSPNFTWRATRSSTIVPRSLWSRTFANSRALEVKKYTEEHEWIELSDDGDTGIRTAQRSAQALLIIYQGTIGVSKYAAEALGDVVYVELPTAGMEVDAGGNIGAVESVKSASDIMTPVSGTVVEANSLLESKPGTINRSPEGEGWIAKIKVEDKGELEHLMSAEEYKQFTEEVKADEEGH